MKFEVKRGSDTRSPVALVGRGGRTLYLQLDPSGLGPEAEGQHMILGGKYNKDHCVKKNGTMDITSIREGSKSYTPVYAGDTVSITF